MKILMVCLGNICRSPMAEGIMKKMIQENDLDWTVDSAGTESFHAGDAPHRLSQKVAWEHQIDISQQSARSFISEDLKKFDKIYAMAEDVYQEISVMNHQSPELKKVNLLLNETSPGENRSIPDPWYGGEDGYHHAWELISHACSQIIEKYK